MVSLNQLNGKTQLILLLLLYNEKYIFYTIQAEYVVHKYMATVLDVQTQ